MTQTILFVALHLLGLIVGMAIGPRRAPATRAALGFPIGLAAAVLLALAILALRVPYGPWTLGTAMALTAAACLVVAIRRGIVRRDLVIGGAWTALFAAACLGLTAVNLGRFGLDSHRLVGLGIVIAQDGALRSDTMAHLSDWGVFQVVAHSMMTWSDEQVLYSLPLVLGLSLAPVFALTLWHAREDQEAAEGRRWMAAAVAALATATLFTSGGVVDHLILIHTNLSSAVYLFGFVVLFWLGETRRDPSWIPPAFVCLTAFALQRTETPLVAVLFLCLTVAPSELPARVVRPWLAGFTLVVALWCVALALNVPAASALVTPTRSLLLGGAAVAFFLWTLLPRSALVGRVNRLLPALVAGVFGIALLAAFATRPAHMIESAGNWLWNLTQLRTWGTFWYGFALVILVSLVAPPPRFRQVFAIGLPVYAALILLLVYFRSPYRLGNGDSANRMTIHLVPLIFYYAAMKCMRAVDRMPARASRPEVREVVDPVAPLEPAP